MIKHACLALWLAGCAERALEITDYPVDLAAPAEAPPDLGPASPDTALVSSYNFVFFTSETYRPGSLGGLAGADARCQAAADSQGLPGIYLAYLSTSTI